MPEFTSTTTSYTVTDFVGRLRRKEFVVNRDYQRSDAVWPTAARSFLIESILLGYPLPKLTVRQMTDLVTRSTTSEIVDGQQRTRAIVDFYDNEFAISRKSEISTARGCRYDSLPDELKQQFLSFSVQADVFSGALDDEIIEMFRRINSNTVSLNKEEQRHARFQGGMKWLVYNTARTAAPLFERFRVFKVKQFARMADAKLIAEVVHAVLKGISTTTANKLDSLYDEFNAVPDLDSGALFPGSQVVEQRFESAFTAFSAMDALIDSPMTKPFNTYALLLALMHAQEAIDTIPERFVGGRGLKPPREAEAALLELGQIMELDDDQKPDDRKLKELWEAASKSTNTAEHRTVRFGAFLSALSR